MKEINKILITIIILLVGNISNALAGVAVTGAPILQQNNNAVLVSLAGSGVGQFGNFANAEVNPAAIGSLQKNHISFTHFNLDEQLNTEYLSGVIPIANLGVIGCQALYNSQPDIDNLEDSSLAVEVKDILIGINLATNLWQKINLGFNTKILNLTLDDINTTSVIFDVGLQYEINDDLALGLVARNLGSEISIGKSKEALPRTLALGTNFTLLTIDRHSLSTNLDVVYISQEENMEINVGIEYWFQYLVALRTGYKYSKLTSLDKVFFGLGLNFKIKQTRLTIDYTLTPISMLETDFSLRNTLSLGVVF